MIATLYIIGYALTVFLVALLMLRLDVDDDPPFVTFVSFFWPIAIAVLLFLGVVMGPYLLARSVARRRGW